MEPVRHVAGRAIPFGRKNVDTDVVIPAHWLKTITRDGLGKGAFEAVKKEPGNVFTDPQIASVGVTQAEVDSGIARAHGIKLPLATNARAKMQGVDAGFVKIFCRVSGTVVGAVVVAPNASELIYSLALAVELGLNVDDLATTFTVYPSLSGSIAEAARRLHQVD